MNRFFYIFFICICFSISCLAETANEDVNTNDESDYLTADELTEDDYNKLHDYVIEYDECLTSKSRSEITKYNDPRHVVDSAMKLCAYELEDMNQWMKERNFSPNDRQRYIQKTSSRSVNKILPAVMMAIASRQPASE